MTRYSHYTLKMYEINQHSELENENMGFRHRSRTIHSHRKCRLTLLDFDQEGQKQQRKKAEHLKTQLISLIVIAHDLSTFYNIQRKHHCKDN